MKFLAWFFSFLTIVMWMAAVIMFIGGIFTRDIFTMTLGGLLVLMLGSRK